MLPTKPPSFIVTHQWVTITTEITDSLQCQSNWTPAYWIKKMGQERSKKEIIDFSIIKWKWIHIIS